MIKDNETECEKKPTETQNETQTERLKKPTETQNKTLIEENPTDIKVPTIETHPSSKEKPKENKVPNIETQTEREKKPTETINEGHEQMSAISGQLFNFALMGNTVSDMVRIVEVEGKDDHFRPRIIVVLNLLGISLICQSFLLVFTIWRFLHFRNKRAVDKDNDCCGDEPCQCCNCCRGTGDVLFTICFILTTVVTVLQLAGGIVGTVEPVK